MARLSAIANTKKNVIICQQRLNLWPDTAGEIDFRGQVNAQEKITSKCDGRTWPYGT
jgi:hypothetical protein